MSHLITKGATLGALRPQVAAAVLALALLILVVKLVRGCKLRDTFALLWVLVGVGGFLVAITPAQFWDRLAAFVGITSGGITLILILGIFFALLLIMQLSIAVTRLERLLTAFIIEQSAGQVSGLLRRTRRDNSEEEPL